MDVAEAEDIAKKYDLVPIIKEKFSKDSVRLITQNLKGFRPRDQRKEKTREEWYTMYQSRIPILKEFSVIITDLIEEIINKKQLTRNNATNGVIGAFRFLQEELTQKKNFNSYKYDAMITLLLYEIKHSELINT